MKRIIYLLLCLVLMASCSTSRKSLRNTTIGGLSGVEYMEKVIEWTPARENLTARTRIELNTGTSSTKSINANMRIRRGEIIRLSVAPLLGIEVVRIDITPDYVLTVDRMNKRYVEVSFSELSSLMNTRIDFNIIQSLILNEIFLPGKPSLSLSDADEFSLTSADSRAQLKVKSSKKIDYSFFTSATDGRLEETVISLKGLPYSLHCSYSDFTMLNRDVFPQRINLYTEGTGKKYSLDMKLSRIGTDSNWDTNTELSSKYKKISLPELLKIFEQLK